MRGHILPVEAQIGATAGGGFTGRPNLVNLAATRAPVLPVPPRTRVVFV
jgi:hypothetical protein